jgi:hypothetical protein
MNMIRETERALGRLTLKTKAVLPFERFENIYLAARPNSPENERLYV